MAIDDPLNGLKGFLWRRTKSEHLFPHCPPYAFQVDSRIEKELIENGSRTTRRTKVRTDDAICAIPTPPGCA